MSTLTVQLNTTHDICIQLLHKQLMIQAESSSNMERLWSVASDKHEDVCLEFTYLTFSVDKTEIQTANVEFFFIEIHNGRSLLPIHILAALWSYSIIVCSLL